MSSLVDDTDVTDLQRAPEDDGKPDFGKLKEDFERAVGDNFDVLNTCRENRQTRYAEWAGQSSDGKKHSREGDKTEPTPWDGASDLQCFLVDEAINARVALLCTALGRANLVAVPIEGGDLPRARVVTNFMRWLVYTQVPNLEREAELLANYILEKGFGITGQFWETCQERTLQTIKVEDLARFGITLEILADEAHTETFLDLIKQGFPDVSPKKAKKMLAQLRKTGETSAPVLGRAYSRPVIRAFSLDEDIFIHPSATDLESAPAIFRVQYYTPAQLRSFVRNDGWDEDWVEDAIQKCIGMQIAMVADNIIAPEARTIVTEAQRFADLIGVVFAYQRLVDEDGVTGVYLSIFNPNLGPDVDAEEGSEVGHGGFAKHGLLGYAHGKYPFVLHRREHLSRRLHDSRGLPEIGKPFQSIVKSCQDARRDAASLSVLPPLLYKTGRPPTQWGPGARIPFRQNAQEFQFADRPNYDIGNTVVEEKAVNDWKEYVGVATPTGDPSMPLTKQRFDVGKFLLGWAEAFDQVWQLYQQYGEDEVYFRVIGVSAQDIQRFQKGSPNEKYDFYLSFDVLSSDMDKMESKLELLGKAVAAADRGGQVNYPEYLSLLVEAIEPTWAERIIMPQDAAQAKAVDDEKSALTRIAAGFDEDIKIGAPPQIGLGVIQQFTQSPDVQQRLQSDQAFAQRLEKRAKQYSFQIQQQQNANIGRLGA